MKKTVALFGTAAALVVTAAAFDLWSRLGAPRTQPPLPAAPIPPTPPSPPPSLTTAGASSARLGDLVTLDAMLSNSYVPASQTELYLKLNLRAREIAGAPRGPMALAIVIDRSGSMTGEKIQSAKLAAKSLVDRLRDDDQIAVVSYATDTSVDVALTEARATERARIGRIIDQIFEGGGTNLSGGLAAGLAELRAAAGRGLPARLVLLSDGNANQGVTDPRELARIAQSARLLGPTVSAIGLGVDFNEDVMTSIAEHGGGSYHYLRESSEIASALGREFDSLAALAARRVEVALELADGISVVEVYGYPTEVRGGKTVIPVGDLASADQRQVVARLSVRGKLGPLPVARLSLGYVPATASSAEEFSADLGVAGLADPSTINRGERREVVEAVEAILAADTRRQAAASYSRGERDRAMRELNRLAKGLRAKAQALGGSQMLETQAKEVQDAIQGMSTSDAESEHGKDLVKSEKYRARQIFVY